MKLFVRAISALPCVALLVAAAPFAHAQSVSGSVYEVTPAFSSVPALGDAAYSSPYATFTVSNASPTNVINFNSNGSTNYTIGTFLASGGDTVTGLSPTQSSTVLDTPAGCNAACTTDSLFRFTGTVTLSNTGTTPYTFAHDDGLILYLTGGSYSNYMAINEPGPTSPTTTDFTVCAFGCDAVAGTYSFILDYGEVSGPPAVLTTDIPLESATPEPSSIVMLGTGLVSAAGLLRRRMRA